MEIVLPRLVSVIFFSVMGFIWNCATGGNVSLALSFLLRGKCHESLYSMLCPHWIVGIVLPLPAVLHDGSIVSWTFFSLSVVVPYSLHFIYHNRTNEELRQYPIICYPHRRNNVIGRNDLNNERINTDTKFKSKSEFDDLLIYKMVRSSDDLDDSEQISTTKNSETISVSSFRMNHPKADLYTRLQNWSQWQWNFSSSSARETSVRLCAICLDEYKVGDTIAYSKNPNCHHEFHKYCILELLEMGKERKQGDCPICRNSYYEFLPDVELGKPTVVP